MGRRTAGALCLGVSDTILCGLRGGCHGHSGAWREQIEGGKNPQWDLYPQAPSPQEVYKNSTMNVNEFLGKMGSAASESYGEDVMG